MPHERFGQHAAPEPGTPRAEAEVRFLVDEEEPLVEQTDAVDDLRGSGEAATVDDFDVGDRRFVFCSRPQ